MGTFPFGYQPIEATTWAYLSSLLMLALFFKFNRFWSFRNFDLLLIVLLAPGLLMVHYGMNPPAVVIARYSNSATDIGTDDGQLDPSSEVGKGSVGTNESRNSATEVDAGGQTNQDGANQDGANQDGANQEETDQAEQPLEKPKQSSAAQTVLDGEQSPTPDSRAEPDSNQNTQPQFTGLQVWQRNLQRVGYLWLFAIGAIWIVRMLVDPGLKRKPFLESNLSSGGLAFLVCSLMIFLFANILTSRPQTEDIAGAKGAVEMVQGTQQDLRRFGPGYALFHLFPTIPTFMNDAELLRVDADKETQIHKYETAAKIMAIVSQVAIIFALMFFGHKHFDDLRIGIGMAAIYLMLPYTAQMTGRVMHLLPAALLIWSITLYRVPVVAGILLGLAATVAYYPLFLIPLFVSFYWFQGRTRFVTGLTLAIGLGVASLFFTSHDWASFWSQLQAMFGFWLPISENLEGIWSLGWPSAYRLPFLAGFLAMCVTFAFWPAVKTLGSLMSCSCAVMLAVQYWHGFGGGLYVGWYIPLALLVVFRPNLDDRVAEQFVPESSRKRAAKSEAK